jgi:predicted double-glycine peptidase
MPWIDVSPVRQEDDTGCGVACVAMVLDCSYPKAKALLFGKRFAGWS